MKYDIGFENIFKNLKKNLKGLKVAPYYGCQLLRPPKEVDFDDPENPTIFEGFIKSLGCEVVDYPYKTECCGSYLSISEPKIAAKSSFKVLKSAVRNGAEIVITTCPLCFYNLDNRQDLIKSEFPEFNNVPVLFFTQLLALGLKIDIDILGLNKHSIDPKPLLEEKNII